MLREPEPGASWGRPHESFLLNISCPVDVSSLFIKACFSYLVLTSKVICPIPSFCSVRMWHLFIFLFKTFAPRGNVQKKSCKSLGHHDCRFKLPKIHTDIDLIDPAWFFVPLGDLLYVKSLASWEKLLFKLKRPIKNALKRHKGRTLKSTCRWHPGEV